LSQFKSWCDDLKANMAPQHSNELTWTYERYRKHPPVKSWASPRLRAAAFNERGRDGALSLEGEAKRVNLYVIMSTYITIKNRTVGRSIFPPLPSFALDLAGEVEHFDNSGTPQTIPDCQIGAAR
jgi:hypothetical protein